MKLFLKDPFIKLTAPHEAIGEAVPNIVYILVSYFMFRRIRLIS